MTGLLDKCSINTNKDGETFVGINCSNGDLSIHFPLGYHLEENADDKAIRQDILLLLRTLHVLTTHKESAVSKHIDSFDGAGFPVQAYMQVIADYLDRGYYRERETRYEKGTRGRINWSKTVKQCRPYIADDEAVYLQFITRRNPINENELITLIHEFCVYESFAKLGWMFTNSMPAKPRIVFNRRLFLATLQSKILNTFNDKNKKLFQSMVAIINHVDSPDAAHTYRYGTNRFEYVWQDLIDNVFGIEHKELFYPQTSWHLSTRARDNSHLEPDTIMIHDEAVFVLDAKYYQYGATGVAGDLPESADINKQITYGDYADQLRTDSAIINRFGELHHVYNAFIMPFDHAGKKVNALTPYKYIGAATANWRKPHLPHESVQGILIDVKHLMTLFHRNEDELSQLANLIVASV